MEIIRRTNDHDAIESAENLFNSCETVGSDHANYAATLNNLGNLLRSQSMAIMNEYDDDDVNDDDGDNETSPSRNTRPVYTAMQRVKFNDMAIL